jgi:hypothetical protein
MVTVAAQQWRNISRKQLLEIGFTDDAIGNSIGAGRLHRTPFPGVFTVGTPARTAVERAAGAVLACGPHAVLSDGGAMALWGFWKYWPRTLEVTLKKGNRKPKGLIVHRRLLLPGDITTQHGIRTTSPARTFLDVARRLTDDELDRDINNSLHSPWLTVNQLAEMLDRHPRHPATKRLLHYVTTDDGPTRSILEREFPAFCRHHGLPQPQLGATVGRHTVDALFPDEKVIVELDGWRYHNTRVDFETDRDRDANTTALGYVTVRITKRRIERTPDREADRLRAILATRRRRAA